MTEQPDAFYAIYQPEKTGLEKSRISGSLIVRPAHAGHIDALAAITCERHGGDEDEHRSRITKEILQNPGWIGRLLLVAEADNVVVGFGRVVQYHPAPDSPPNVAPAGWYLGGVIVRSSFRRRGAATELTRRRLEWIAERADEAFYTVDAQNQVSISLHARFHFVQVTRDFYHPGVSFTGEGGILFRAALKSSDDP